MQKLGMEDFDLSENEENKRPLTRQEKIKKNAPKIILTISILILTVVIYRYVKPEDIRDLILSSGAWGQFIYVICWIFLPMGFFPVGVLAIIGGMGFGLIQGIVLTFIGAAMNLTAMFFIARYLFRDSIQSWLKRKYPKMLTMVQNEKRLKQFLVFARIVPLIPYTVENYVFGLTDINAWEYLYLSLVFIMPGTFIYVNIGDKSLDLSSPAFAISIVLWLLISIVPIAIEKYRKKNKGEELEDEK